MPTCDQVVGTDNSAGQANDAADNNVLTLTLDGAYPYAGCQYTIDVDNVGTVPAHFTLTGLSLEDENGPIAAAPWTNTLAPNSPAECTTLLGAVAGGVDVGSEIPGIQLHADQSITCTFILALDQVADAEGHSYTFTASFTAHQWNETP